MSQHPLGSSQDEEHSLASVAYLSGSFPRGDHGCADAGGGTALCCPASADSGKGPVASFVPSSSWPGLQGPSTMGCEVASRWWYFTPVEQHWGAAAGVLCSAYLRGKSPACSWLVVLGHEHRSPAQASCVCAALSLLEAEPELLSIVTCCTSSPPLPRSVLSAPVLGAGTIPGLCNRRLHLHGTMSTLALHCSLSCNPL